MKLVAVMMQNSGKLTAVLACDAIEVMENFGTFALTNFTLAIDPIIYAQVLIECLLYIPGQIDADGYGDTWKSLGSQTLMWDMGQCALLPTKAYQPAYMVPTNSRHHTEIGGFCPQP